MPTKKSTRKSKKVVRKKVTAPRTEIELVIPAQDETWDLDFKINQDYELTERQKVFLSSAINPSNHMCIVDGPAGTAKTYIAVLAALKLLNEHRIDNIIYIRSIVESASRSMGALPGELEEKFAPWSMPLIDKLDEILDGNVSKNLMSKNYIKCIPVNFTRGLTFKNSCVIIDEAQNMTRSELITILTRFGVDSKYLVVGDTYQADIGSKTGFKDIFKAFDHPSCSDEGIDTFKFNGDDIVRSEILRFIVERLESINND